MINKKWLVVLFFFLTLFSLSLSNASSEDQISQKIKDLHQRLNKAEEKGYIEDELIVSFKPSYAQALASLKHEDALQEVSLKLKLLKIGVKSIKKIGNSSQFFLIKLDKEVETLESAKSKLMKLPEVEYVEPNYIYKLQGTVPNDFYNFDLWALQKIQAPQAWDIAKGSNEVIVAVIDSGVDYTHEDLAPNMWINKREIPDNGIDDDGNGYVDDVYGIAPGYSQVVKNIKISDPMDVLGHGTHVAGIIGAVGNNGKGIVGVNWNVKILSCMAAKPPTGFLYLADTLECYEYIASLKDRGENIKVINASYGGPYYSYHEFSAIQRLRDRGILFVAAAGNEGNNNDISPEYPCNYNLDNIICVVSTDRNDNLSWFSNYGNSTVHVAAPGEQIYSTYPITLKNFNSSFCNNIFFDNFESGTGNWYFNSPAGLSTEYFLSPTHSITDSVEGDYPDNATITIVSRYIDLSPYKSVKLYGYFSIMPYLSDGDSVSFIVGIDSFTKYGIMLQQNGEDFDALGLKGKWTSWVYYIPREVRKYNVQLAFKLEPNDDGLTDDGIYWDNIGICAVSWATNKYEPLQGTSMATPFVSGLAALIWSKEPNLSYLDVKNRILSTVDVLPQLSGKVKTSGRINAYRALLGSTCTPPFTDIPCDFPAINEITWAKNRGITKGYPDGTYRPYEPVKRDAMAAFIVRALFGDNPTCQGGVPCESTQPYFKDVDQSQPFFRHIQKLYEAGITKGWPDGTYRPYENIRRDAMAAFLIRALGYGDNPICSGGVPCENTQPYFMDVAPTHPFYKHIQKLKELGITTGCRQDPPMYCPDSYVTRDAMAVFLYRAFSNK
jgi:subtilisin family serine protease